MATGAQVTPTHGESLLLDRRRKNHTQVEAAVAHQVSVDVYRDWEADHGGDIPRMQLGQLKPHEICLILRRRAKLTQKQLAAKLGVTRLWVIQMENGEVATERLTSFWGV